MMGRWSKRAPTEIASVADAGFPTQVQGTISRNSVFLIAGQVAGRAIGLVYILILARYLGVEDFGTFNLVISFVLIAVTGSEFGLGRMMARDLARDAALVPSYLSTLLPLRGILAVGGYLALLAVIWAVGYSRDTLLFASVAALALLPTSLGLVLDSLFQARQQMRHSAAADVIVALVQCSIGTAIVVAGGSLTALFGVGVLSSLAYLAFLAHRARASGYPLRFHLDRELGASLLRKAVPFATCTLLAILASRAELLVLGVVSTAEQVGLFSAAARFPETALLLPAVLVSAAAPVIAQYHTGSREQLRGVYLWTLRRVLAVTLALALAGVTLAEGILALLFPPEYSRASLVMQLLFCAFPLASLALVNSAMLLMSNLPRLMLLNAAVSTIAQFVLGLILIPRFGLAGAAVSALVCQAFNFMFSYWCIRRWFIDPSGLLRYLAAPVIAGFAGALIALLLLTRWGSWSALPALVVYGLTLGTLLRWSPTALRPSSSDS